MIARAVGPSGPNADYLLNTVESLEALGLHDPDLARLARAGARRGRRADGGRLTHLFVRGARVTSRARASVSEGTATSRTNQQETG